MVVLGSKVYVTGDARERALDGLRGLVNNRFGDLDVEFEIGHREDDFPVVTVSGPDEVVARNVLREEFGEVVPSHEAGESYVGTLDSWDDDGFVLDAGPAGDVRIPAANLELGQGSPAQIRKRFGLVQHLPLRFEFEEAMEFGFECPECGTQLEAMENTRMVEAMEWRLDQLRDELNLEAA